MYSSINDMYKNTVQVFTATTDEFNDRTYEYKCDIKCAIHPVDTIVRNTEGEVVGVDTKVYYKGDLVNGTDYLLINDKYMVIEKLEKTVDMAANTIVGGIAYL